MKKILGPELIPCRKCGAAAGKNCFGKLIRAHTVRWNDYNKVHLTVKATDIPKPIKVPKTGSKRLTRGFKPKISGRCQVGKHSQCYSVGCICPCRHGGGN